MRRNPRRRALSPQRALARRVEDFERHYFECDQCASAVESGDEFIANARAVLTESPERRNGGHMTASVIFDTLFDAWRQPVFTPCRLRRPFVWLGFATRARCCFPLRIVKR